MTAALMSRSSESKLMSKDQLRSFFSPLQTLQLNDPSSLVASQSKIFLLNASQRLQVILKQDYVTICHS